MKKLGIITLLMVFGVLSATMAQKGNTEMKQYYEEEIQPVLEQEQKLFYKALSSEDLERVQELKTKMNEQSPGMKQEGAKAKGKKQGRQIDQATIDEVSEIADAYPEEVKDFQRTMEQNKGKWMEEMVAIRSKNSQNGGKGKSRANSAMFDRMSEPGWLLLWDKDRDRGQRNGKGSQNGRKRTSNSDCSGKADGKGMNRQGSGMKNGMGPGHNMNPELKEEIRAYAGENIIPVIAKERQEFNSHLSTAEKEEIALAQGKRKARRIMFQEWYKSEDFEAGARRDDPNFDIMREDMQKSMNEIRSIADVHQEEIEQSLDNLRSYSDTWEKELKLIADKYENQKQGRHGAKSKRYDQKLNPVQFLLFNLDEQENTSLFDLDRKDMVELSVSPNPVSTYCTIRIRGANNMQTEVNLYTKEGKLLKTLYNDIVIGQEVSFGLRVSDLENNIYILRLNAGGNEIARKIIVQK